MAKRKTPQVQNAEQGPSDEKLRVDLERALARLDLVISRLGRASNEKDPIEIGLPEAQALYGVTFSAMEDLAGLRDKLPSSSTAG